MVLLNLMSNLATLKPGDRQVFETWMTPDKKTGSWFSSRTAEEGSSSVLGLAKPSRVWEDL
jgi:hypothetical protein